MARGRLAPGFRFHPTDEELVRFYLRRKVMNKPFRLDPICVVDVYKCEPWDLPDKSKLKSRDLEWYFFCMLDKKYSNGSKTNRATEKGYWKTTGKDRPIKWNGRIVGMKKTLVYHQGRAPRGERSNWVMHEYRLTDEELEKSGVAQDAFVLCRIFQKSGTGPKNGEQYGAPFVEEEWDKNDELKLIPGDEVYVESSDLLQNIEHSGNSVDLSEAVTEKGIGFSDKLLGLSESMYETFDREVSSYLLDPSMYENPNHYEENGFANPPDNLDLVDSGFDVEEFLNFFDAEDKNLTCDVSELVTDPPSNLKKEIEGEEASCSQKIEPIEYEPETKPSFKKSTTLLDSIPAPPVYTSEFPIKALQPGQSSTTIHVRAGLIRIQDTSASSNLDWPISKSTNIFVQTSYFVHDKTASLSRIYWLLMILFWILIFSVSFRIRPDLTAK